MTERSEQGRTFVIAAGGTGGHLFPAQALAEELRRRSARVVLMTDARGVRWRDQFPGTALYRIVSGTVTQARLVPRLIGLCKLAAGTVQAFFILLRQRPAAVIGFGGYPSLPGMFAAILRRDVTCLHEQNGVMGRANRLLSSRVTALALSFPEPRGLAPALLSRAKVTGNPVRANVIAARDIPYPPLNGDAPLQLLVFGGSQGATVFSRVVPEAIARLDETLRRRLRVVQQCRAEDAAAVAARYDALGVSAEIDSFFSDLPQRMAAAHLVICRSGASTVCELAVIGRPALMVPLPGAIDGDQAANAAFLERAGGGWLIAETDLTPDGLAQRLTDLFTTAETLVEAAAAARAEGRPHAASALADFVTGLARAGAAEPALESV